MMKKRISNREFEVLYQVSLGYTTDEIATNLYISAHTVITHRKSLRSKLKARNAPQLIRRAYECGVLKSSELNSAGSDPIFIKRSLFIGMICIFAYFTGLAQMPLADIEGDVRVRGDFDIHHAVDSTVVLIGHRAGEALSDLIFDLQPGSVAAFPIGSTFVGTQAGQNSIGLFNSYFGFGAGLNSLAGTQNAYFGYGAGYQSRGDYNSFFGFQSGVLNTEGFDNVFIGSEAGYRNDVGSYNTFIGKSSGLNNVSGESNTFIGWQAGSRNIAGHSNTMIGDGANISYGLDSLNRSIALGYNATVACHSCAVIGGIGEDAVNVGIAVDNPVSRLHVMQQSIGPTTGMRLEVNTETDTITANMYLNLSKKLNFSIDDNRVGYIDDVTGDYVATSDARLKKDVTNLGSVISRIMMLTPQWYRYRRNQPHARKTLGLMAQELKEYFPELVTESEGTLGVAYAKLGVLAIKGLQEQEVTIEQQKEMIQEMKLEMANLKAQVAALMTNIE